LASTVGIKPELLNQTVKSGGKRTPLQVDNTKAGRIEQQSVANETNHSIMNTTNNDGDNILPKKTWLQGENNEAVKIVNNLNIKPLKIDTLIEDTDVYIGKDKTPSLVGFGYKE